MAESLDLFAEVASLRDEIEDQGTVVDALLRASAAELKKQVLEMFAADPALGKILLLVDGERSQKDIGDILVKEGEKGASAASVSRKLDTLAHDLHLVILDRRSGSGKVYRTTRVDKVLGISRQLQRAAKK